MGTPDQLTVRPLGGAGPLRRPPSALRTGGAWAAFVIVLLCRAYRAGVLTMAAAALAPMLWGYAGFVVRSGSMEPVISTGDVAVTQPLKSSDRIQVGRVMLFDRPPEGADPVLHRVVAKRSDGRYTTAGDANAEVDSSPVERERFRARGLILVPWVGLPFHWLATGEVVQLLLWSLLTVLAFVLPMLLGGGTSRPGNGSGPREARPRRGSDRGRAHVATLGRAARQALVVRRATAPLAALVAVGLTLSVAGVPQATAGFSAKTSTRPNTWKVAAKALQKYTVAVLDDDPYVFYRFDEPGGTTAADTSGYGLSGTYTSVASYRQPGALPNNFGYSIGLNGGTGRMVMSGPAVPNPSDFSVELWFKTSSKAGGKLLGFESTRNATSTTYDRHVFMRPDGRLVYGGWSSNPTTIVTPAAYNNGGWHQLVLTSAYRNRRQESVMYVDGQRAVGGVTTPTGSFSGWWRVGYGSLPNGSSYPPSANFVGQLDDVSGYNAELSASRVAAHYAAR